MPACPHLRGIGDPAYKATAFSSHIAGAHKGEMRGHLSRLSVTGPGDVRRVGGTLGLSRPAQECSGCEGRIVFM